MSTGIDTSGRGTAYMTEPPPGEQRYLSDWPSIAYQVQVSGVVTTVIALVTVVLRIFTRVYLVRSGIGIDDLLVVLSALTTCAFLGITFEMCGIAIGRHFWQVTVADYSPYFLAYSTAATMTYSLSVIFSKLSILFFYLRLSPQQSFRFAVIALIVIVSAYALAYQVVSIFSCKPMRAAWDITITDATCVDKEAVYMGLSISNIIMDVIILLIPIQVVYPLQMSKRQKVSLLMLFATGGLKAPTDNNSVCASAIKRTVILPPLMHSPDYSWDVAEQFVWSYIEVNAGIICATVPALKPFFVRYVPKLLGASLGSSYGGRSSEPPSLPLSTTVEQNKLRRYGRKHSTDPYASIDDDGKALDEDERKLWTQGAAGSGNWEKMGLDTVVSSSRYIGKADSSSLDSNTDASGKGHGAHGRSIGSAHGINVTHETRVDYTGRGL
ncbi:Integral membrane protein [Apiospora rasikravindrae]|uniref:Integral membrane protein n=1 Tax=Apiospora rasikravindrae TaxID=990691 RepID=A0ABR1RPI5_9PEZI